MLLAALVLNMVFCGAEQELRPTIPSAADLFHEAARLFERAEYAPAAGLFRESLRLDPAQPRAAKALGVCYQILGDLKQAAAAFRESVRLDGSDAETWFFLGRVYYMQHFYEDARPALQSAVHLDPSDPRTHELLALVLESVGQIEAAGREHQAGVTANHRRPQPLWTPHLSYGVFLHKLNRSAESETQLRLATSLNPRDWLTHFELAKLYCDLERFEEAVRESAVALGELKPDSPEASQVYRLQSRAHYRMGRGNGARRALSSAESLASIVFVERAREAAIPFVLANSVSPDKRQIETMPAGVGVIDYDNDGFEDLFFVNGAAIPGLLKTGPAYWNRLYRNNGNGTFTDVTIRAGLAGEGYSMGVAVGDYDNDGWDDLLVTGVRGLHLYHNNGDGTFRDTTARAGLAGSSRWSISAGWFDYDNDGRLDLFVVNYCRWSPESDPYCGGREPGHRTYCSPKLYEGLPSELYRNNGDGTFTDVSASSGIAAYPGKGMAVAFADYDGDGRLDVFVTNDTERNFLFHNDGAGRFTETGLQAGVAFNNDGKALSSMGADFRDIDNDGRPDILTTALSNETFTLFQNAGGVFRDATYPSRLALLSLPWAGWGVGIFDLDNDGRKDVFTANSFVMDNVELYSSRTYRQANSVFANTAGAEFADARAASDAAVWTPRTHRGCAFGDFDNDGRVDIAVSSLNDRAELLLNRSDPSRHWLDLLLTGSASNRDAIGAEVRLFLPSGRVLANHVTTSVGYASSSSRRVHFGLGAEAQVSRIEIRWPSHLAQTVRNVNIERLLHLVEPSAPPQ